MCFKFNLLCSHLSCYDFEKTKGKGYLLLALGQKCISTRETKRAIMNGHLYSPRPSLYNMEGVGVPFCKSIGTGSRDLDRARDFENDWPLGHDWCTQSLQEMSVIHKPG